MSQFRRRQLSGFGIWLVMLAGPLAAGQSNSLLDLSTDGALVACSNRDSGTVTILDSATFQKRHEITVGKHPEGVAFLGSTHRLAIAVYGDDQIVFVDADRGEVTGRIDVFDEPYGVVSNRDGSRVWVTLEFPGQIVEVDIAAQKITRAISAGSFPRGLALTTAERHLVATEYFTATVRVFDAASGREIANASAASTDNIARQVTLHPTRNKIYLPHQRSKITAVHGEGSIFPYVSVVDFPSDKATSTERGTTLPRKRMPMDAFIGNLVTSNPWEVAISPDGQQAVVAFGGTDDIFVCKVIDDNYRELTPMRTMNVGHNPRAVKYSPDGKRFWLYNALDFEVVAYDATTLQRAGLVRVTENPLGDEILRGKRLFYSALQPMASRRWIACSSCHPDSDADGRTWHNPEGLRNTPSLVGLAWTHPQHWSADRDETQDFEHTIRGPLMQGRGLISGPVAESLAAPNKGRSADLDALAAYTNSHAVPLSPFAQKGLTESARRGRELFNSAETGCTKCHSGPYFCDSNPRDKTVRHDVGTGRGDKSERMGTEYDTPTLLGVYRTAPYLHDGSAASLRDVLTTANSAGRHGKTSQLQAAQIDDLIEFLKSLPYEDPAPLAETAGLKRIAR